MVLFNYSTKELTAKIVYYGPGLCGKTTNLQYIHQNLPEDVKGKMLSLATKTDRTLFFDFLPIDLGNIRGMKTRVQLYTVPGQVFYNETRKLVLKGADAIVFVADSQEQMLGANVESFRNLEENLKANGMSLAEMPHVLQFNKRDLPKLSNIEELNSALNKYNAPFYESVATTGIGVQDTLKAVVKLVLLHLTGKYEPKSSRAAAPRPAAKPRPSAAPDPSPQRPAAAASQERSPAPAAMARSIPLSDAAFPVPKPTTRPPAPVASQPRASIPLSDPDPSPMVAGAMSPSDAPPAEERAVAATPPPPPNFRGTAGTGFDGDDDAIPAFADDEIEDLVDEVGEAEEVIPVSTDPGVEWAPEQPIAASAEDWDGGATVALEPGQTRIDEIPPDDVLPETPEIVEPPVALSPGSSLPGAGAGLEAAGEGSLGSSEVPPPSSGPEIWESTPETVEAPRDDSWADDTGISDEISEPAPPEESGGDAWIGEPAAEPPFEVDRGFDPEWPVAGEPHERPGAEERDAAGDGSTELSLSPEPMDLPSPEPIEVSEPEPIEVSEPEPIEVSEPEPIEVSEPEPIEVSEPGPIEVPEPESMEVPEPEPIEFSEPEPIELPSVSDSVEEAAIPEPPEGLRSPEPVDAPAPEASDVAGVEPVDRTTDSKPDASLVADDVEEPVLLTEVAEARDLFEDPGVNVAELAPGTVREIVIPVEIGEGDSVRRFRLTVKINLDPVG